MRLLDVEPTGTTTGPAFVCGGPRSGLQIVEHPVYPDSGGRAFRLARVAAGLSLRETARRLGLSAVELGEVERGAKRPESWDAFFERAGLSR